MGYKAKNDAKKLLDSFGINSPEVSDRNENNHCFTPWGDNQFFNSYPNVMKIWLDSSSLAQGLVSSKLGYIVGNIPESQSRVIVRNSGKYRTSIRKFLERVAYDCVLFDGSFCVVVIYDFRNGFSEKISQVDSVPIENIRYMERGYFRNKNNNFFEYTDCDYILGEIHSTEDDKITKMYTPFCPEKAFEEYELLGDGRGYWKQMYFRNTAHESDVYPKFVFRSAVSDMITQTGMSTSIMSLFASSELFKTYVGRENDNSIIGSSLGSGYNTNDDERISNFYEMPREESVDDISNGPNKAGSVAYIDLPSGSNGISSMIHTVDFPKFIEEFKAIDSRAMDIFCMLLKVEKGLFYQMASGVMNQENREMMFKEINLTLESTRKDIEEEINHIFSYSNFGRVDLLPFGEGEQKDLNNDI